MKTPQDIINHHIVPLVKKDQYNDVEQAVEALESLVQEAYKKGHIDGALSNEPSL